MSEQQTEDNSSHNKWNMDAALNHIYINEIIFISLVFLCFFGELLMDVFDRVGVFYWTLMIPVFFYASWMSEQTKKIATGKETEHLMRYELFYWGSAFVATLLVLLSWHAEIIKAASVGIIIHIILAHTMFLSGMILGFRYYLVGTFLFCTAALTILMQASFGLDLLMAIPIIFAGLYWEKEHLFPTLKRNDEFVKDLIDDQHYDELYHSDADRPDHS